MTIKEAGEFVKLHGYINQSEGDIFWFENQTEGKMIILKGQGNLLNIGPDSKLEGFTATFFYLEGHTYTHDSKTMKYYKADCLEEYFLKYPNFYY